MVKDQFTWSPVFGLQYLFPLMAPPQRKKKPNGKYVKVR